MAQWNANNRACTTTWTTLRVLGQISKRKTFRATGHLKMNQLTFFSSLGSDEAVEGAAKALSIQIHNVYTMVRRAELEPGVTFTKAKADMAAVLTNKEKTVADLAEKNDENYLFWRERDES